MANIPIQVYLNLKAGTTGLSIQGAMNTLTSQTGLTIQEITKLLLATADPVVATPTGKNIGVVDMLNAYFGVDKYSFQDCAQVIYEA